MKKPDDQISLESLREENAKLRKALEEIRSYRFHDNPNDYKYRVRETASIALEQSILDAP